MAVSAAAPSPQPLARAAGAFYLLTFVIGFSTLAMGANLLVSGNPEATAAGILARPNAVWQFFAAFLLGAVDYIVVSVLLYRLLAPVNKTVSLTAAVLSITGCTITAAACVFIVMPFRILNDHGLTAAFTAAQLHALAYGSLKIYNNMYSVGLCFFGFYCSLVGYLILRSGFIPKFVGVLMLLAGLNWLTFLWPPLSNALGNWVLILAIPGELSLTLWLLIAGVNEQRWRESAGGATP